MNLQKIQKNHHRLLLEHNLFHQKQRSQPLIANRIQQKKHPKQRHSVALILRLSQQIEEVAQDWPHFDGLSLCYPMEVYRKDWKQLKNEILAGIIVSFAQIPESIAFAYLAGVPASDGLQAAWIVGLFTALFGGRPSLISGATGAIAAVQSTIKDKSTIYPIMVLAGVWITLCGVLNLTKFAR
eukprot:1960_1